MPERVATARIIVGTENERKTIEPGTRFNPSEYGISDEDLKRYDADGVTREPRDEPKAGDRGPRDQSEMTPRQQSELGEVVENRSERATEVTSERETNQKDGLTVEEQRSRPTGAATVERARNEAASDRAQQHARQTQRRNEDL